MIFKNKIEKIIPHFSSWITSEEKESHTHTKSNSSKVRRRKSISLEFLSCNAQDPSQRQAVWIKAQRKRRLKVEKKERKEFNCVRHNLKLDIIPSNIFLQEIFIIFG